LRSFAKIFLKSYFLSSIDWGISFIDVVFYLNGIYERFPFKVGIFLKGTYYFLLVIHTTEIRNSSRKSYINKTIKNEFQERNRGTNDK
jgi:hypothetical protein